MKNKVISKYVDISKPISFVFEALTDSSKIIKFYPLIEVLSEWKKGSEVLYKGELEGVPFTDYGTITSLVTPNEFSYVYWSDNHGTERTEENLVSITYKLAVVKKGTRVTIFQSNLPNQELYEAMDNFVWDFLLGSLKSYLEKTK